VATTALLGPLRERRGRKRVALIVCGSNIQVHSLAALLARGAQACAGEAAACL
jgi:threonine dehydratase